MLCALLCPATRAHAAITLTCGTAGNFGTVTSQVTSSGPNSMVMSTTGTITYPAVLSGPATGTPITRTISGSSNGNKNVDVYCDASRVITNSGGGSGGTANRNMTAFSVSGAGKSNLASTPCLGIGTLAGSFTVNGASGATLNLGATMDATHVLVNGSAYQLSNNAAGPVNVKVTDTTAGLSSQTTANFSVTFAGVIGFPSVTNLSFGKLAFTTQPTSADHVDLGTNGTAVYAGTFTAQGGTLNAGQVTMNNVQNGVVVEVRCDTATTMTGPSSKTIQVTGLKVAAEGSTGPYASAGAACAGSGAASPATTMVYNSGSADQFFFGGKLDGGTASSGFINGSYATTSGGYANVNIVNQ